MSVSTERFDRAIEMIGAMCSEGRPPKMSIPVQPDDEDIFITDTLREARDYITELVRVARRAKVLLKKEWLGTQLQEDIDAALAKYKEPT